VLSILSRAVYTTCTPDIGCFNDICAVWSESTVQLHQQASDSLPSSIHHRNNHHHHRQNHQWGFHTFIHYDSGI